MRDFFLYTSINIKNIKASLANIKLWHGYSAVQGIRLIQNDRESLEISSYVYDLDWIRVINTESVDIHTRSWVNSKELPSLQELISCMSHESAVNKRRAIYGYLNSDIIITSNSFFEEVGSVDKCITLVHRKDIASCNGRVEEKGYYMHGIDAFFVNTMMLKGVEYRCSDMFYLGLPGWDQYLPLLCWINHWPQRYLTSENATHKIHETSNPGSYRVFANRLIIAYVCEYYLKIRLDFTRRILSVMTGIGGNYWMTSMVHKLVVFTALRSLGWRIQRKSHLQSRHEF